MRVTVVVERRQRGFPRSKVSADPLDGLWRTGRPGDPRPCLGLPDRRGLGSQASAVPPSPGPRPHAPGRGISNPSGRGWEGLFQVAMAIVRLMDQSGISAGVATVIEELGRKACIQLRGPRREGRAAEGITMDPPAATWSSPGDGGRRGRAPASILSRGSCDPTPSSPDPKKFKLRGEHPPEVLRCE